MEDLFRNLISFEEWFIDKLVQEKKRRIKYIKMIWDNLTLEKRADLIQYINNVFLLRYITHITKKNYDELFTVIKSHIENSFEIIQKWEKDNL